METGLVTDAWKFNSKAVAYCLAVMAVLAIARPGRAQQDSTQGIAPPPFTSSAAPTFLGVPPTDPYQISGPSAYNAGTSGVENFLVALFGGSAPSAYSASQVDPYAASQFGAPAVAPTAYGELPIIGGSSLDTTIFPGFRQRVGSRLYIRAEYLRWDVSGMDTPSLVTTSPDGTGEDVAGVIGQPGTTALFGGGTLNDGSTSGGLISGGYWVTPARKFAIETEYFGVGPQNDRYNASSNGGPILARPFFDAANGAEGALLVSYPGVVSGGINVATESELRSFLFNGRVSMCPSHGPCCPSCGMRDRTDWIVGYRNIRLTDSMAVDADMTSQLTALPGSLSVSEQFDTKNQFNGLQLGVVRRTLLQRAWLESALRVAIGNNEQQLRVSGTTTSDQPDVVDRLGGQLLAQRTNSGSWTRDEFVMIPEISLRLGMRVTKCLHASIGYSVLYLPNVIRASEQIDRDVNSGLIPIEADPLTGPARPRVLWVQSDYLAHGIHFGGELHF